MNMLTNHGAGTSRASTWFWPPAPQWLTTVSHRFGHACIMRTDIWGTRFPDDDNTDGSRNVGSLATQPPETADSPRKFFRTHFSPAVTTCPVCRITPEHLCPCSSNKAKNLVSQVTFAGGEHILWHLGTQLEVLSVTLNKLQTLVIQLHLHTQ